MQQLDTLSHSEMCNLTRYADAPLEQQELIVDYHIYNYYPIELSYESTYVYKDASTLHMRCLSNKDGLMVIDVCLNEPMDFVRLCADLFIKNKVCVIIAAVSFNEPSATNAKSSEIMDRFKTYLDKFKAKLPYNMFIDPVSFKVVISRKVKPLKSDGLVIEKDKCHADYNNYYIDNTPFAMSISHSPQHKDMLNVRFEPPLIVPIKSSMNIFDHCIPERHAEMAEFDMSFETPYGSIKPADFNDLTSKFAYVCPLKTYAIIFGLNIPQNASPGIETHPVVNSIRKVLQEHDDAAAKIQEAWRKAISDPSYTVCRKRLMSEFTEFSSIIV